MQIINSNLLQHILNCEGNFPPVGVSIESAWENKSDEELIAIIKQTNTYTTEKAVTVLYNRYHREIWMHIRRNTFSDEQAHDLFGAVWTIAVSDLPTAKYQWQGKEVIAWLKVVANNKIKELKRGYTKREKLTQYLDEMLEDDQQLIDEDESEMIIDWMTLEQNCKSLTVVLNRLKKENPAYHEIIMLKFFNGLCYKEISDRTGKKYANIRQTYLRALSELKCMFKEIGD